MSEIEPELYPTNFYIRMIQILEKEYHLECVSAINGQLEFVSPKYQDSFIIPVWFAEQLLELV